MGGDPWRYFLGVLDEVLGVAVCVFEHDEDTRLDKVIDATVVEASTVAAWHFRRSLEIASTHAERARENSREEHAVRDDVRLRSRCGDFR